MVAYKNIILEVRGGVGIITLNNPESRNPLTEETKEEMLSALDEVERDGKLRALIITGRGPAFCAGGDIKKIGAELTPEETSAVMKKSQQLLWKILDLEKPVVVLVREVIHESYVATRLRAKAYVLDVKEEKAYETDVSLRVKQAFAAAGIRSPAVVLRWDGDGVAPRGKPATTGESR